MQPNSNDCLERAIQSLRNIECLSHTSYASIQRNGIEIPTDDDNIQRSSFISVNARKLKVPREVIGRSEDSKRFLFLHGRYNDKSISRRHLILFS